PKFPDFSPLFQEYLFLLRSAALALDRCGPRAVVFAAAAVSDFYIPWAEMVSLLSLSLSFSLLSSHLLLSSLLSLSLFRSVVSLHRNEARVQGESEKGREREREREPRVSVVTPLLVATQDPERGGRSHNPA